MNQQALSALIWLVAERLRGDYNQFECGQVILPFTVLRRLDYVLENTKAPVLTEQVEKMKLMANPEPFLLRVIGNDGGRGGIQGFSLPLRDIFERFDCYTWIDRLHNWGLLYQVAERCAQISTSVTGQIDVRGLVKVEQEQAA